MDSGNAESIQFKQFDVVAEEPKDHHYLHFNESKVDRKGLNYGRIMRERGILGESLPESIYVQAYATRIDLLRAVIIGSPGTPYHDGLFFFDIVLPCDYPNQPPHVYYHSHGHRLNPSLYADGKVCLSLINTVQGSEAERWSVNSTILQILVSIQGLVLNERPYFDFPSFEIGKSRTSSRWVYASIGYNEEVFILSCKTMVQIMRQPPLNFENFVVQHFRGRAASILAAIEHYQKGHVLVGQFDQMNAAAPSPSPSPSPSSSVRASSIFEADLIEIQHQLKDAFAAFLSLPDKDKALARLFTEKIWKPRKRLLHGIINFPTQIWKSRREKLFKFTFFVIIVTCAILIHHISG